MILLFGGTSETSMAAEALADVGLHVLVSTATEIPLSIGCNPRISSRHGRLTESEMISLINSYSIRAVVDVAHPYATELHCAAKNVAIKKGIPCLRYLRPEALNNEKDVVRAKSHDEAARLAFAWKQPVLLTVGSKNVGIYAQESQRVGTPMIVRVLDHIDSLQACAEAGIPSDYIIAERGPFSVEENRAVIRRFGIRVLVAKESGMAGGLLEKLEAARQEGCQMIVVSRPLEKGEHLFSSIPELVRALILKLEELSHVKK